MRYHIFQLEFKIIQPLHLEVYLLIHWNLKIISSLSSRLSDHDVQLIRINGIDLKKNGKPKNMRKIGWHTVADVMIKLS